MREIKFRAWDKKLNEMVYELLCFYEDGGISHNNHFSSDEGEWRGYMWNSRDLQIMQYTGLKDKNGEEIYEGDILSGLLGGKGEVFYREDMGLYEVRGIGGIFEVNTKDFEIVGNIFENPELIS